MTVREWFRIQRGALWARDECKPLWVQWSGADLDGVVTACLRNSLPSDGRWTIGDVSAEPNPDRWLLEEEIRRREMKMMKTALERFRFGAFPPVLL